MRNHLYTYKNVRILNKTDLKKETLHKLIDFCRPKKIKRMAFNLLLCYCGNYRKTLRDLNLDKPYGLRREHPFRGIAIQNFEKVNKYWVSRPIVIVTRFKHVYLPYFNSLYEDGYLCHHHKNQYEELITLFAHELMHLVQNKEHKLNNHNLVKRERECERYALNKVKQWRRQYDKRKTKTIGKK